jgi:hypothetical protein
MRTPNGIRTRVSALKGRDPRPLDDGGKPTSPVARGQRRQYNVRSLDIFGTPPDDGREEVEVVKCPYCAEEIQESWVSCPYCGSSLGPGADVPEPTGSAEPLPAPLPPPPGEPAQEGAPPTDVPAPRRRKWLLVAAIVATVALVGGVTFALTRSPSDKGATPKTSVGGSAQTHPGWTEYTEQADGFAISLPPDWTKTGLDLGAAIKFQAASKTGPAAFPANLNVVSQDLPVELSLDDYVELSISQIATAFDGVTGLKHERVALPGIGDAEKVEYHFNTKAGVAIAALQYVFLRNMTGYVLTFGTVPEDETSSRPTFEGIAQTFHFLA